MQEVEGVVNGTYDYLKLKGDTGQKPGWKRAKYCQLLRKLKNF
jgi:hypothetical protein